jgi:hypothetical protein
MSRHIMNVASAMTTTIFVAYIVTMRALRVLRGIINDLALDSLPKLCQHTPHRLHYPARVNLFDLAADL